MRTFRQAMEFGAENAGLILDKTCEHLLVSFAAMVVAALIALPLGMYLGHVGRGAFFAINISNIGRALPSLAVMAIGLGFLGIGFLNSMVALVVVAVPTLLTNSFVAISRVDQNVVLAARAAGMRASQVLLRVELPLGLPMIFAGVRTATLFVIGTATIAALAGGGGLGDIIVSQAEYGLEGVVAASIALAILALVVEALLALTHRQVIPRAFRAETHVRDVAGDLVERV